MEGLGCSFLIGKGYVGPQGLSRVSKVMNSTDLCTFDAPYLPSPSPRGLKWKGPTSRVLLLGLGGHRSPVGCLEPPLTGSTAKQARKEARK